jgi:hypothetical protein
MSGTTLKDIEHAIGTLAPQEIEELYAWLDEHHPHLMDARVESDLSAGRLDQAIRRALDDEQNGRVQPL